MYVVLYISSGDVNQFVSICTLWQSLIALFLPFYIYFILCLEDTNHLVFSHLVLFIFVYLIFLDFKLLVSVCLNIQEILCVYSYTASITLASHKHDY